MDKKFNWKEILRKVLLTAALPLGIYLVLGCIRPDIYMQGSTFAMLLTQSLSNTIVGWAMLFGMSVGLFDFSVGSRIILAELVAVQMSQYFGVAGFIFGALAASLLMAALTGAAYAGLKIPSIITGFAALLIFESVATIYQKTFDVIVTPEIKVFGTSPGVYIVIAICFVLVYILFNNTKFGYQIKAIGGNEAIARSMGIKSVGLKLNTYVIGGIFLGIAAMVKVGYSGAVIASTSMASMSQCFTPMMGVMIGLYLSSCNPVIGTFVGAFSISVVSSGLVALNVESRLQNVVVGVFLLLFIGIKSNSGRIKALWAKRPRRKQQAAA